MDSDIFSVKNKLMENVFPDVIEASNSQTVVRYDISILSKVLLSSFVMHQGCYLLEFALPAGFHPNPEQAFPKSNFTNQTSYECYENHLHTVDILKRSKQGINHLLTGIILADYFRYKLEVVFPAQRFRIIVSYPVLPISPEDHEIKNDCTVRFHAVRDGEVIFDNLDDFKYEAMGIIEV